MRARVAQRRVATSVADRPSVDMRCLAFGLEVARRVTWQGLNMDTHRGGGALQGADGFGLVLGMRRWRSISAVVGGVPGRVR